MNHKQEGVQHLDCLDSGGNHWIAKFCKSCKKSSAVHGLGIHAQKKQRKLTKNREWRALHIETSAVPWILVSWLVPWWDSGKGQTVNITDALTANLFCGDEASIPAVFWRLKDCQSGNAFPPLEVHHLDFCSFLDLKRCSHLRSCIPDFRSAHFADCVTQKNWRVWLTAS